MKKRPTYRLPASTLVEVLVAMALAGVIFTIGAVTFLQLNGHEAPYRQLDRRLQARELLFEAAGTSPTTEIQQAGNAYFLREFTLLNGNTQLYQVNVKCFTHDDRLLFQRSKILRLHES